MSNTLYIYGTEDCTLCDHALTALDKAQIPYQFIDIVNDDALVETFGWFIPVIRYQQWLWKSPLDLNHIIAQYLNNTLLANTLSPNSGQSPIE